jgi:hypothetical protein
MNNLTNNPAFLKRMENAVEFPTEETSVDFLTVGLCILVIAGTAAVAYKMFEPRIIINHYYPPIQSGGMVQPVVKTIIPAKSTATS